MWECIRCLAAALGAGDPRSAAVLDAIDPESLKEQKT